ncbi:acyltransferase [Synechococcus sp. RSCCF101]|uniref:acyltransferase family protein n=1 Tax=Synechococcus sp. RSCCF101 TaxID=2511069 RepID=UPI001249217A|nr:acyltransferase [Synechococcus sp. RSCCF101]QEY31629.1 acyltransferase [Synechococcus sp. RSCCF101]
MAATLSDADLQGDASAGTPLSMAPDRCEALDATRFLAVLLLIPFHTAAIFYRGDLGSFYLTAPSSSAVLSAFVLLVHQWHMPLFFLLAGAASWHSLQQRTAVSFLRQRLQRLLLPLVVGTLLLVPPQVYVHAVQSGEPVGGFLRFYPHFFDGVRPAGHFEWGHLWFLAYLLAITLAFLPLMQWLTRPGRGAPGWPTAGCPAWVALLLPALPLMLSEALLRPRWPGFQNLVDDWANVSLYGLYFLGGFLFCHLAWPWQSLDRFRWPLVLLAGLTMGVFAALELSGAAPALDSSWPARLFQAFRGANTWYVVLALLALARRFLAAPGTPLHTGAWAGMPLYLLHQPVLVAVGWVVVPLPLPLASRVLLIAGVSLLVCAAVIGGLLPRLGRAGQCFGMPTPA